MKSFCLLICLFRMGREVIIDRNKTNYYLTEHTSNLKVGGLKDGGEERQGEMKERKKSRKWHRK